MEKLLRKEYFDNYLKYVKEIKEFAKEYFKDNFYQLILFGSIIDGNYSIGLSDIDIAIILKNDIDLKEKVKFLVEIDKKYKDHPFEIHIIDINKWENWYKRFVKNYKII